MHQNYQLPTINPTLLDLKAHPKKTWSCPEATSSIDSTTIATSQAGCEAIDDYGVNAQHNFYSALEVVGDTSASVGQEPWSPLLYQTTPKPWNDVASGPAYSSRSTALPPFGENEPWSQLQTSAAGASLAPRFNDTSSQCRQNGYQWSTDPSDTTGSYTSSMESYGSCLAPTMHQRMLQEYQIDPVKLAVPQHGGSGHEEDVLPKSDEGKTWDNYSTSLVPWDHDPSPVGELSSSTTAPIDIPGRGRPNSLPAINVTHAVDPPPSIQSNFRNYNHQARRKLQSDDHDAMISYELLRQQQLGLNIGGAKDFSGITNAACQKPANGSWDVSQRLFSDALHQANEAKISHPSRGVDAAGMSVAASSFPNANQRYCSYQASSFPPTAGCFPISMRPLSAPQKYCSHRVAFETAITPQIAANIPAERQISRNGATQSPNQNLPAAVAKNHHRESAVSTTNQNRGRRRGRLDPAIASAAGQKRSDGTVCIRCKMLKQTCPGDLPCEACQKNSSARSWGQPCHKAKFVDIVEAGTCNRIFQRSASVSSGSDQKMTLSYSVDFHLKDLVKQIQSRQSRYNIIVRHFSGSWYTLSLARLEKEISKSKPADRRHVCTLDDFAKPGFSRLESWLECIVAYEPLANTIERSIKWNNMPSRNSYSYLPLDGTSPHRMVVDSEQAQTDTLLAIQLCRIVVRMLEVKAFKLLQRTINELPKNKISQEDLDRLAQDLIEILFSLRWRLSWWKVFGDSSGYTDAPGNHFTERVTVLAQTLYFWYFVVKKRIPPKPLNGVYHSYADTTQKVYDDYPHDESLDGCHQWLAHGRSLVETAFTGSLLPRPFSSPYS
ncbi:hypothetical protein ACLMJK_000903 [Lecanora helva]